MSVKNGFLAIALMSGLALAACSNTAAGVEEDARDNAAKADAAAERAEDKADAAGRDAKAAGREAAAETRAKRAAQLQLPSKPST